MPKGVEKNQLANAGTASTMSNTLGANAANIYGSLEPTLQAEASHPSGYTPTQIAAQNTAAQQSAGGSTAGAVGQGGLYAARTRNAGGAQAAIGDASRGAGEALSRRAVGTEVGSADLANKRQAGALGGMESLYGTNLSGSENALGLSNSALSGANETAGNNPWMKILMQGMKSAGDVGAAYAGASGGGGGG